MTPPILVAYSPTSADRAPVDFAATVAAASGAPLVLAAVAEHDPISVDHLREQLGLDASIEVRIAQDGTPAAALETAIAEVRPALVVVGSTHRGRVSRALSHGGTTGHVADGSTVPVVVVPHEHAMRDGGLRTIGAAFVPTDEGRAALGVGAELARMAGARLLAVSVHSGRHASGADHELDPKDGEYARERLIAQDALNAAIAELAKGVDTEPDMLYQETLDGLEAASQRVDLLVIGGRASAPLGTLSLGGVAQRLITGAASPVLLLPRGTDSLGALRAASSPSEAPGAGRP